MQKFAQLVPRSRCVGIAFVFMACLGAVPVDVCVAKQQPQSDVVQRANESYAAGVEALRQRDLATARARFEEAAKLVPESAEAHNSLGYALFLGGDLDAAIPQFEMAIRLKPALAQAHENLAVAFWRKKNPSKAVREAKEAVRLAPTSPDAYRALGRALELSHDLP